MPLAFRLATPGKMIPESTSDLEITIDVNKCHQCCRVIFFCFRYYRVLKSLDMTNSEHRQRVLDMLGEAVFKKLAMRVTIDKMPDEGSDTADFLEELKEQSNLHFKATTPGPTEEPVATQVDEPTDKKAAETKPEA